MKTDSETTRHHEAVQRALKTLEWAIEPLSTDEVHLLTTRVEQVAQSRPVPQKKAGLAQSLAGREYSQAERLRLEQLGLLEHFRRRRSLLEGALTASQVAELLSTSRQTPHDRAKSGSLLAVADRGMLRFPAWQFDPESDNGVVTGLPLVVKALRVSPLAKISWLLKPNPVLGGCTPLESVKAGHVERVVELAKGVGRS